GISEKALSKILSILELNETEKVFLNLLRTLAESNSHPVRIDALAKIQKVQSFRKNNPDAIEVIQYLSEWHYVAIREMAALTNFKNDPRWISRQLKVHVPQKQIAEALAFLIEKKFIELDNHGRALFPEKNIQCFEQIYQVSLRQFHRQMLRLAGEALDHTEIDSRHVLGHTVAISKANYDLAKTIMEDALKKIAKITKDDRDAESVYHMIFAAFPLTKLKGVKP
ncbi:MAG: DUF4423 domain-containing protein, partial [Bdellovibrionota bacterium]